MRRSGIGPVRSARDGFLLRHLVSDVERGAFGLGVPTEPVRSRRIRRVVNVMQGLRECDAGLCMARPRPSTIDRMREDDTAPIRLLTKLYSGVRIQERREVVVVVFDEAGVPHANPLPLRNDLGSHSAVFEWGHCGAGATQLALAVLADYFGDGALALRLHQRFAKTVIAELSQDAWNLGGEAIVAACAPGVPKL